MSNNSLFRTAGWCAALSVLFTVISFVMFSVMPTSPLSVVVAALALLVVTVVFYALYVLHRSESAGLSLFGLVAWIAAAAVNFASLFNMTNQALYGIASLLFALPLLVFGFLAYRSARVPRGLAVLALLGGVLWAITGAVSFGGSSLGLALTLVSTIVWAAWLVWLWRFFSSGKLAKA